MASRYHNISGELTQELLAVGDNVKVSSVSLTNLGKIQNCKVDLYIEKKLTGKFYIMKSVSLPIGATLSHNFSMNNSADEFGLYIKLTKGDTFTLTGSINVTGTNTNVPGTSTAYLSEISIGDEIVVSGETRTVSSIENDTTMVVSSAWGSDLADDTSPDCNPEALVDVIIS